MLSYPEILSIVKTKLGESERMKHTLEVVKIAELLAQKYQANIDNVKIAALLHDVTKYESFDYHHRMMTSYFTDTELFNWPRPILHALSAVVYAHNDLKIDSPEILNSIQYHTTGRPNMSLTEKIIFVADFVEPTRRFDNHEYRNAAFENINKAVAMILDSQYRYLLSIGEQPVPIELDALKYYQNYLEE